MIGSITGVADLAGMLEFRRITTNGPLQQVKGSVMTLLTLVFKQPVGMCDGTCLVNPVVIVPRQQQYTGQRDKRNDPADSPTKPADWILVTSRLHVEPFPDRVMNTPVNHQDSSLGLFCVDQK